MAEVDAQPNILLIVSDEERRNDWLEGVEELPAHQRLRGDGLSFDRYFTHASPCSPSRASLYTGRYLAEHGVVDNVAFPTHAALDPAIPTIGSLLAERGYRSSYLGKWHLGHSETPDMAAHGYLDWEGNDVHFMGSAYTGRYFDPIIVDQAIDWLNDRAGSNGFGGNGGNGTGGAGSNGTGGHGSNGTGGNGSNGTGGNGAGDQPWFLTVALVNPHDIMWFPADHRSYQAAHPKFANLLEAVQKMRLGDLPVTPPPEDYPRLFDRLPDNFSDDLHTKPEVQRAWRHVRNREHMVGRIDADDHDTWLRGLDYYAWLHVELDASLARLLDALDTLGLYDDTVIAYTSDHGDACGSHGLRAKLPCVYDEVMGVPLIVKAPGMPSGARTQALAHPCGPRGHHRRARRCGPRRHSHAVGAAICRRCWPTPTRRCATSCCSHRTRPSPRSCATAATRCGASTTARPSTPATTGSVAGCGATEPPTSWANSSMWTPTSTTTTTSGTRPRRDPHELVNLANDRGRCNELRTLFRRLLDHEAEELKLTP